MEPANSGQPSDEGTSHKPQLPHGWIVRVSKTYPDRVYYYNTATGVSTWELPGLISETPEGGDTSHPTEVKKRRKRSRSKKSRASSETAEPGTSADVDVTSVTSTGQPPVIVISDSCENQDTGKHSSVRSKTSSRSEETSQSAPAVKQSRREVAGEFCQTSVMGNRASSHLAPAVSNTQTKPSGKVGSANTQKSKENVYVRNPLDISLPAVKTSSTAQRYSTERSSASVQKDGAKTVSAAAAPSTNRPGGYGHQRSMSSQSPSAGDSANSAASFSPVASADTSSQGTPSVVRPTPLKACRSANRKKIPTTQQPSSHLAKGSAVSSQGQAVGGISSSGVCSDEKSRQAKRKSDHTPTPGKKTEDGVPQKKSRSTSDSKDDRNNQKQTTAVNMNQETAGVKTAPRKRKKKKRKSKTQKEAEVINLTNSTQPSAFCAQPSQQGIQQQTLPTTPGTLPQSRVSLDMQGIPVPGEGLPKHMTEIYGQESADLLHQRISPAFNTSQASPQQNVAIGSFPTGNVGRGLSDTSLTPPPPGFFHQGCSSGEFGGPSARNFDFAHIHSARESAAFVQHDQGQMEVIQHWINNHDPRSPHQGSSSLLQPGLAQFSASVGDLEMEVDEDDDQIMMDLQEIRGAKPDVKKVVGMLTESIQQSQRSVTPVQPLTGNSKMVYIVLDTNVLMGALAFVQNLRDMWLKGLGRPYLIVPWVVLQELDALKGGNNNLKSKNNQRAQNAVRYLHSCFVSKHPRVRGQTPAEACEVSEHFPLESNDDHILQCCVQCQKKYSHSEVMLLTDDKNLHNKAAVMGLSCSDSKSLIPLLTGNTEGAESPCPDTESGIPANLNQSVAGKGPSPAQKNQKVDRVMVDDLLCSMKAAVETCLKPVVEAEMKEAYGEIWTDIVYRKPPWSAYDLICNFQKHWMAVFGLKFPRPLQSIVEELATKLKPETATKLQLPEVKTLIEGCLQIVHVIKMKDKYTAVANQAESQLQTLLNGIKGDEPPSTEPTLTPPVTERARSHSRASNRSNSRGSVDMGEELGYPSPAQHSSKQHNKQPSVNKTPTGSFCQTSQHGREAAMQREDRASPSLSGTASSNQVKVKGTSAHSSLVDRHSYKSPNNNSVGLSSHQDTKTVNSPTLTANYKFIIQNTFQAVWSAIFNCCNNIEGLLGRTLSEAELTEVKETLAVLVPLVQQIRKEFSRCLSFSPIGLERHTSAFAAFCSCLNGFFATTKIPSPDLPKVTASDMIAFMADTTNRVTLLNGLKQLDEFIVRLQKIMPHIPA